MVKGTNPLIKKKSIVSNVNYHKQRLHGINPAHWPFLRAILHLFAGILTGCLYLWGMHYYILNEDGIVGKFIFEHTQLTQQDRVWIDPIIGVGIITVTVINIIVSFQIIRNKPFSVKLLLLIWFVLGIEISSCLYCFEFFTDPSMTTLFTMCPHMAYPRAGLLVLICFNIGSYYFQNLSKKKSFAIISIIIATTILAIILATFGAIFFSVV